MGILPLAKTIVRRGEDMERVQASAFEIRVNGQSAKWSELKMVGALAPVLHTTIHTPSVSPDAVLEMSVGGTLVFTGVIWQAVGDASRGWDVKARTDWWKLNRELEPTSWHQVSAGEIISDIIRINGMRAEIDESTASNHIRRFSTKLHETSFSALRQLKAVLESNGEADIVYHMSEKNTLRCAPIGSVGRSVDTIPAPDIIYADARGIEILPRALRHNDSVVVENKGRMTCDIVTYTAQAGGRSYVRVWGNWDD